MSLRRFSFFLLVLTLLTACAGEAGSPALPEPPPAPSDEPGGDHVPLRAYIIHPQEDSLSGDGLPADETIDDWADSVENTLAEMAEEAPPEPSPEQTPEPSAPATVTAFDPDRPMVALTFDDGPSKHTDRILDVLELYNGRASFFTIGNLLENRRETVLRAFDMGCEVLGHSWDHRNMTKLPAEELQIQLLTTNNAIEAITGVWPRMFRPPYGAVNNRLKSVSADLGFTIVNWSVDPVDWKVKDADAVYTAIMTKVKDKDIILSHDLYGTTADAMERVIPDLIGRGYQLVTVSELLTHVYGELEPGRVYTHGR